MRLISSLLRLVYLFLVMLIFIIGVTVISYQLSDNTAAKGGGASSGMGESTQDKIDKIFSFYKKLYGIEEPSKTKEKMDSPSEYKSDGIKIETINEPQSSPSIERINSPGF